MTGFIRPRQLEHVMERLIYLVAPTSRMDLVFKATILVGTFTLFDLLIKSVTADWIADNLAASLFVTFMIGAPFGLFVMTIMAAQRRLQDELTTLSQTDPLTGLLNRRSFLSRAEDAVKSGRSLSILMLDLDHFKKVNDTMGHYAGDLALMRVGKHLKDQIRSDDIVGRIGGEEFALVIFHKDTAELEKVIARVFKPVKVVSDRHDDLAFKSFEQTFSMGGTTALPGQDLLTLMGFADRALYTAKAEGRFKTRFYAPSEIKVPA